jgi:hypothetical protein
VHSSLVGNYFKWYNICVQKPRTNKITPRCVDIVIDIPGAHYCYSLALEELKLHTLRMRRHRLDALFLTQVYFGLKFCPSVLEIVGLRVPAQYIRDLALFNACSSCKNCPSARCASPVNVVCRDADLLGAGNVHLNNLL